MNKEEKNRLIKELHEDRFHESVISSVTNEAEKRQVKTFTDEIYISLIESLTKTIILGEFEDESIPNE